MYLIDLYDAPFFLAGGIEHHELVTRGQPVPKAQGKTYSDIIINWCDSDGLDDWLDLGQEFMDSPESNPNHESAQ